MTLFEQLEALQARIARIERDLGYSQPARVRPVADKPAVQPGATPRKAHKLFGSRRWTDNEDKTLIMLRKDGQSTRTIARELGRSSKAITSRTWVLKKNGTIPCTS